MTRDALRAEIRRFVATHANLPETAVPEFDDGRNLFEHGDIDSFGFVELLLALSESTGRDFDLGNIDPSDLAVVGTLIDYFANGATHP
jgi:acyl carrier protein